MKLFTLLVLAFVISFSALGQPNEFKKITSKVDTVGSLSRTGKVVRISYQFSIKYSGEHENIETLMQFCSSEVQYSIRQEVLKYEPDSVESIKIKSSIQPTLDSVFLTNKIQLLKLTLEKL
ncbi:MAG: hypothetical protein ABJF11_06765 [Reichenbachiella sp.]|uniref:hypothetical protein n=1 Tax=Reichenbachiella sp. TaxID=2184521 RepID=UPI003263600F